MLRALRLSPSDSGFSLGEFALVSCLVCMLLISLVNLFPSSLIAVNSSQQRQQAYNLAQNALAMVQARSFTSLHQGPLDLPELEVPPGYELSITVTPVDPYSFDHLKRVSVRVDWQVRQRNLNLAEDLLVHPARP